MSKDKGIWVEGPGGHGMKGHLVFLSLPRAGFTCLCVLGSVAVFCQFWERLTPQLPLPGSRPLTIAQNSAKLGPFSPLLTHGT